MRVHASAQRIDPIFGGALEAAQRCPGHPSASRRAAPSSAGFSLIELLIVVAVLAILAGLAIPNFAQSKIAANEAAAISYMRNWTAAQELYHLKFGVYADADNQLVDEGLIGVGSSDQLGYRFSLDNPPGAAQTWWGQGRPVTPGQTGNRFFYIDSTGVIRVEVGHPADANSPPLAGTPSPSS